MGLPQGLYVAKVRGAFGEGTHCLQCGCSLVSIGRLATSGSGRAGGDIRVIGLFGGGHDESREGD
jgi:hypothetical protein